MRIDFRQGVVSYQAGGFLSLNGGGHVDVLAAVKPTSVTVAHKQTNYLHSEDATVNSAWSGPFISSTNYWLYWEFNPLTFDRTFNQTTLEPVAQSVEPGLGNTDIVGVTPGDAGLASFVVDGHYIQPAGKNLSIVGSTANDGNYTVSGSTYNTGTGETTISVDEEVLDATVDGQVTIDVDSIGDPLKVDGRFWFNTSTNIHYILSGNVWVEVLVVFAALLTNANTFISVSINGGTDYTGTQIGNTSSVLAGRVLFNEAGDPLQRDDRTFFTTEDQFFSTASRVDGIRIESNVSRAQYSGAIGIAKFTPVSYIDEGKIEVAQYPDVNQTVIGMLMEDLLQNEVGAVVIQGVVTNPDWNWLDIGVPLWVDNGTLNPIDPHVSDPVTYPSSRVPVARVLSSDSVVFEQGLGGVGDQGPVGSVSDLPPATTTDIGAVLLSDTPNDSLFPTVITTTDISVTNARIPLPHVHPATDISFLPGSGIGSANVQLALEELGVEKVNIAGDTMTGFLTLHAKPVNDFHAATKNYVDQLVLGLIWLEPIDLLDLISDTVTVPPISPEIGDAYIVPPGASGDWSVIAAGNIAHWEGTFWHDLGALTTVDPNGARLGISITSTTAASGSFAGQDNNIAEYDATGTLTGFEVPTENNAVYVSNEISHHAYNQYAFNGTDWVLMGGGNPVTVDDTTTILTGNVLSVKQASAGGTVDAATWDGLNAPLDLGVNLQILQTDGAGNTDWVDAPSGGGLTTCNLTLEQDEEILVYDIDNVCWLNQFPNFLRSTTNDGRIQITDGIENHGSPITILAGDSATNNGGDITIQSGLSTIHDAGNINIVGGSHTEYGGDILLTSGQGDKYHGGDIKIIALNDGGVGGYTNSSGGILLKTSDGSKYQGNALSGKGVVVELGEGTLDDKQHLHVVPTGGGGLSGVVLHTGPTTSSNGVTLVSGNNVVDYKLTFPSSNPGNTSAADSNILVSNASGFMDFNSIPYDLTFSQLGVVNDGDILGYISLPRAVKTRDNFSHVAICRTAPITTDAVFEFGSINTSNVEVPIGTMTITAGLFKSTTTISIGTIDLTGGNMHYVKCLTASSIEDVSISFRCDVTDLD